LVTRKASPADTSIANQHQVAMFGHDYEQLTHKDPLSFNKYHNTGVARPLLANRVSYVFDLHGPSVMLDTACSGSLAAVNSACQSLRVGETYMALAGGVGLIFSPDQMALMSLTGYVLRIYSNKKP
jgi:acyl transferase domain-containing protein